MDCEKYNKYEDIEGTEYEYDDVGRREMSKTRCKKMNWHNAKEITAYEIAYCIYTHKLPIDDVPEKRKKSVQKKIDKLVKKKYKETNEQSIKSVLAVYESDAIIHKFLESGTKIDKLPPDSLDTATEYILDPELFANVESAQEALVLVEDLAAGIYNAIMRDGVVYKDGKYPKKIESARKATIRLFETYEKLGIPRLAVAKALKSIEYESNTTVKQELDIQRKEIADKFISLGNSPTNAKKIANAITLLSEQNILITSKF